LALRLLKGEFKEGQHLLVDVDPTGELIIDSQKSKS